ncbi:ester cyclase [Rhizobium sp. CG5]|uniref:nuclear transport factor 2 family protein n=1 Tax=Rhizobium sp. CG5 TaxID=2726076 RepID=UPI002033CD40|nr:ester cyclase [Rhizobium sp. CG5]MCM2477334.1 ester cyclase [Rhizobium sp. CG5]
MSGPASILTCKHRLYEGLQAIAEASPEKLKASIGNLYHPQVHWRGAHPLNEMRGIDTLVETVWLPLKRSFPDLERRDTILIGGSYEGRDYVATVGQYCGTFREPWLTIPATGRPVYIRYGEVHQVEDGRIVQSNCLWDILDVMRQAGFWPLAPSLGTEGMWPGPLTADGIVLTETDAAQSASSIAQTLGMHQALGAYGDNAVDKRQGLLNMPQKSYWHEKMMWYGPSGIGTTRGLQGFVDYHQLPFREAFKRPVGTLEEVHAIRQAHGAGHYVRIGDGPYSVTGGWPSVYAIHDGGGFLGLGPTGRPVTMRVMDFYLHHEGLIRENWVPLDILDLLKQMDIDVFDRMRSFFDHRPFR